MKKIINGKMYNTETAKLLGEMESRRNKADFYYYCESLYLKKTGEYFLFGEGHGLSPYGKSYGNSSGWGEKIMPFTIDEAKEWAEENLDADEYIKIFGEVEE